MRRRGFTAVTELGWWESVQVGGLEVTFVPAHLWSRRGRFDHCPPLWGGFVITVADGLRKHVAVHVLGNRGAGLARGRGGTVEYCRDGVGRDRCRFAVVWAVEHRSPRRQRGRVRVELGEVDVKVLDRLAGQWDDAGLSPLPVSLICPGVCKQRSCSVRLERPCLRVGQLDWPVIAPDHVPGRRHRRRPRGRDGPQDGVHPDPAAGSVSMLMRQAWICAMPRLSLSDSSRPDRWMYRNVESVLA